MSRSSPGVRRVDDDIDPGEGPVEALAIPDVAEKEADRRMVELTRHLVLLELVPAEDDDPPRQLVLTE